jgi:glutamate formiminotransferase/formiminotetrahydrofolate cyclodeaminase
VTEAPPLSELSVRTLVARLATREPVPGGGSAAAIAGALAAALVEMVAALSVALPDLAAKMADISEVADGAARLRSELLDLAQRDADAYAAVALARRLPRATETARAERGRAVAAATEEATRIPLLTAEAALAVLELAERVAVIGTPHAVSDAGVAAQLACAAVHGAVLNVRINLPYLAADAALRDSAAARAGELVAEAGRRNSAAQRLVDARLAGAPVEAAPTT